MLDKEKVIKGLNHCFHGQEFCDEIECPYYIEQNSCYLEECQENLKEDVLSMLKEQEHTINELQNAYEYLQKQFFEVQDKLLEEQEKRIKDLQDHCDIRRSVKLGCLIEKK